MILNEPFEMRKISVTKELNNLSWTLFWLKIIIDVILILACIVFQIFCFKIVWIQIFDNGKKILKCVTWTRDSRSWWLTRSENFHNISCRLFISCCLHCRSRRLARTLNFWTCYIDGKLIDTRRKFVNIRQFIFRTACEDNHWCSGLRTQETRSIWKNMFNACSKSPWNLLSKYLVTLSFSVSKNAYEPKLTPFTNSFQVTFNRIAYAG